MYFKTFLLLLFLGITILAKTQCVIYCKDVSNKNTITMIGFKLFLEPLNGMQPVLISNSNGTLFINRTDIAKLGNRKIVSFQFLNPLEHERYAMPYELKTRKYRLRELCGKSLIVGYLW